MSAIFYFTIGFIVLMGCSWIYIELRKQYEKLVEAAKNLNPEYKEREAKRCAKRALYEGILGFVLIFIWPFGVPSFFGIILGIFCFQDGIKAKTLVSSKGQQGILLGVIVVVMTFISMIFNLGVDLGFSGGKNELQTSFCFYAIFVFIFLPIRNYYITSGNNIRPRVSGSTLSGETFSNDSNITCPRCYAHVPVVSGERPLEIKCPNCGTTGTITE